MSARARSVLLQLLVLVAVTAPGCTSASEAPERTELSVFAASSLTEAFQDLERGFQADHPDVDIKLTFAGSQVLRLQLEQGAGADVFASANQAHMQALADAGVVSESRTFARNELVVIVPLGNPAGIRSFQDLRRARRLVLGTDNVPAGMYARQVLDRAKTRFGADFLAQVQSHVVSEESNVRLVRAKVELGEADAAIVYRTDAASSAKLRVVPIPSELEVSATYAIGIVARSRHAATAMRFIDYLLSPAGQETLAQRGFGTTTP
jgi:molybdate transport system substrate-binding protein